MGDRIERLVSVQVGESVRRSRYLAALLLSLVLIACSQEALPPATLQLPATTTATSVPTRPIAALPTQTLRQPRTTVTATPRPPTATMRPWFTPPAFPTAFSTRVVQPTAVPSPTVAAVVPTPEPSPTLPTP